MKKLYSTLLVVALAAAMVLPVLAAPSPKATAVAPATAVEITVADAEVKELAADEKAAVIEVTSNATHLTNLGVSTASKLVSSFNLEYKGGEIPADGIQIPVKVTNAKAGDYAYLLHLRSDNGSWEVVGQGYLGADLTVIGTFKSFSPVAVMVVDAADVAAAGIKAPKTGEF